MPGLDGLRALAVIAVLLYHGGLTWIPGGFLGVEVFFVISGYLITALLLAQWRRLGRIDVRAFWLGRARRLLPALYLVLVVTLAYAVVFLPGEVAGLRGDVFAALGYVTNWYLIFGHESYFEAIKQADSTDGDKVIEALEAIDGFQMFSGPLKFTDEHTLPRENTDPLSMVAGVDGALYISEFMGGVVSRMTIDGTFTKAYRIPGGFNDRIISAPDGALWVAQGSQGKVSRLDIGLDYPVTAAGTTFEARAGKSVNATVATFTDGDPNARARDYDALISWGDGDRSYGTVQKRADGSFAVKGKHTYAKKGTRKVTVRITDGVGRSLDAKVTSWAIVLR